MKKICVVHYLVYLWAFQSREKQIDIIEAVKPYAEFYFHYIFFLNKGNRFKKKIIATYIDF